jgi:hypothetical protein
MAEEEDMEMEIIIRIVISSNLIAKINRASIA